MKTFDIVFDCVGEAGVEHVYHAGDEVKGQVRVSLIEPIRLNGIAYEYYDDMLLCSTTCCFGLVGSMPIVIIFVLISN